MSAGAIGGTTASQANQSGSTTEASQPTNNAFADLSSEDFVNILVTELTHQDPFKPNDTSEILQQLSSLRNIESQTSLQDQLQTMVDQNAISSASGLIGQEVTGLTDSNKNVTGIVKSLVIENGKPILKLEDGTRLAAENVTDVGNLGDKDTQVVQQLLRNLIILNSSALVGKMVSGYNEANSLVQGIVTSVVPENNDLTLELDTGQRISAGAVVSFTEPDAQTSTTE